MSGYKRTGGYFPYKFVPGQVVEVLAGGRAGELARVVEGYAFNSSSGPFANYKVTFLRDREQSYYKEWELRRHAG